MKAIVDLMLRNASHSRVGKPRNTTSQIYKSKQEPGDNQTFSSLERGDEYNLGTIQYPLDLGSNENGHYMLFYIYEQTQSKYAGSQVTSRVNEGTDKERAVRSATLSMIAPCIPKLRLLSPPTAFIFPLFTTSR